MKVSKSLAFAFCLAGFVLGASPVPAQDAGVVVLREAGLPTVDAPHLSQEQLEKLLPGARFSSVEQLGALLSEPASRLLVLPYGSAFPEEAWAVIYAEICWF